MQVLTDENKRLVKALAQKQFLERFKRALAPNLGIHLLQAQLFIFNAKQRKEIR
jgi:hypothetical protein